MNSPLPSSAQAYPLAGSAAARLHEEAVRRLTSGDVPRCPHPGEPAVWNLDAGMVTCGPCATAAVSSGAPSVCHLCGKPASAVAAWVTGGVACLVSLCEGCHRAGILPLAPN